jgi:hypothetical protein
MRTWPSKARHRPDRFHLAWLEHGVAVGKHDRCSPLPHVVHGVQGARIQAIGERVVDEPARHAQHHRVMHRLASIPLQGAQVVNVTEFASQLFENLKVPVAGRHAACAFQVLPGIGLNAIIVDERVVDIEQKDDIRPLDHRRGPMLRKRPRLRHDPVPRGHAP